MAVISKARTVGTTGPGGLGCPCCSDWNPRRDMARVRRLIRRRERRELRNAWRDR